MKLQITSVKDPTLQHLSRVDYVLHPTFKQRIRTSTNPSNGFAIDLRAWGTFDVTLKLYDTNEKVTTKVQSMKNGLEWR
jgi:transcription initiation factor IIF auxiliary subunit